MAEQKKPEDESLFDKIRRESREKNERERQRRRDVEERFNRKQNNEVIERFNRQ